MNVPDFLKDSERTIFGVAMVHGSCRISGSGYLGNCLMAPLWDNLEYICFGELCDHCRGGDGADANVEIPTRGSHLEPSRSRAFA